MIDFTFNGEAKQFPENWQEVAPGLLPGILRTLFVEPESPDTYTKLLRLNLGYSDKKWRKLCQRYFRPELTEKQRERNAELLAFLVGRLAWMWKTPVDVRPVESVRVGGTPRLLPDPELKTVTYGELTDAYVHLVAFVEQLEPGEKRLNLLLSTVCRPEQKGNYQTRADWNGDARIPYNEHVAQATAEEWADVPLAERLPVFLYVVGAMKNLLSTYDIFAAESIDTVGSQEEYPGQGLIKNQHSLAEKGIFGNMKETRQAGAHEVLLFLEEQKKDDEFRAKAQAEADRKK